MVCSGRWSSSATRLACQGGEQQTALIRLVRPALLRQHRRGLFGSLGTPNGHAGTDGVHLADVGGSSADTLELPRGQ